jgi:hypothetical protein
VTNGEWWLVFLAALTVLFLVAVYVVDKMENRYWRRWQEEYDRTHPLEAKLCDPNHPRPLPKRPGRHLEL